MVQKEKFTVNTAAEANLLKETMEQWGFDVNVTKYNVPLSSRYKYRVFGYSDLRR